MFKTSQKTLAVWLAILITLCGAFAVAEGTEPSAAPTATEAPVATEAPAATEAPDQTAEKAQWTVLIYLCGTDLESQGSMGTYNLQEIAATTPEAGVNVVIETGGAREWHAKETLGLDIAVDKLQRYHFDAEGFALDEELPLDNMASASTLTDFIQWGAKAYPAEKYMLLLWDHGGGSVSGLVSDELHGGAIMPLNQLEIALNNAGVQLEAIALDTCLMATLETAQAVQNSAKYLVASEETVPGKGSAFQTWLQYLYNNPACDGARFGKVMCDATQQKYAELGMTSSARQLTFSVIDLSKIDAVGQAFDKMVTEISALLANPEDFNAFGYYTQNMQHYYYSSMVDIADMASRAQNKALSNDTANAVIEAVDSAVVYNVKGDQRSYSHGLSFYYEPTASDMVLDHYARSCKSAPYLAFLDAVSMGWTAPEWVYEQTERVPDIARKDYTVEVAANLTGEGLPLLTVTNAKQAVAAIDTLLYQYDKRTDSWLALGEDTQVDGDFDVGVFMAEFPQQWFALNGNICRMSIEEETATHTLYNIPFEIIIPELFSLPMQFRAAYVYDVPLSDDIEQEAPPAEEEESAEADVPAEGEESAEEPVDPYAGHYEFYGVWDQDSGNSTALPSRNTEELSAYYGYDIQISVPRVSLPDHYDAGTALSKAFKLNADLQLNTVPMPKGDYAMVFKVTDVFGKIVMSDPVYVAWNGKTATYSGVDVVEEEVAEEVAEEAEEPAA